MRQTITCPKCDQKVRVPDDRGELQVKCPKCDLKWFWAPEDSAGETTDAKEQPSKLRSFFSKMKNAVTGSSAELRLETQGNPIVGSSITVITHVAVGDQPVKIRGAYLTVRAEEVVTLPWSKILTREQLNAHSSSTSSSSIDELLFQLKRASDFTHFEPIIDQRREIAAAQMLEANKEYAFACQVDFASGSQPTFKGRVIEHIWTLQANLDVLTVDPKTPRVQLDVRAS